MAAQEEAEEDLEGLLQTHLSVLATLADENDTVVDNEKDAEINEKSSTDQASSSIDPNPQILWQCLGNQNSDSMELDLPSSRAALQPWLVEWQQIGALLQRPSKSISPFQIHAIASQALQFGGTSSSSSSTATAAAITHTRMYHTTCFLLCCHALQQCPANPPRFWKRWRSLVLETMRLYQRYILVRESHHRRQQPNQKAISSSSSSAAAHKRLLAHWKVDLCCDYLIPSVWKVRQEIRPLLLQPVASSSSSNKSDYDFGPMTVAASGAILTALLRECVEDEEEEVAMTLANTFYDTMNGDWRLVWCQPWRIRQRQSRQFTNFRSETISDNEKPFASLLSYWSCWRDKEEEYNEEAAEDNAEKACFVNTVWDPVGVAVSAVLAFDSRPLVWSMTYSWDLLFPHVPVLLEQQRQENNGDDEDEEERSMPFLSTDNVQAMGFALLHNLLEIIPSGTLSAWETFQKPRADLPVIQTFQLLTNHILRMNAYITQQRETGRTASRPATLPDATQSFLLMKRLLNRYKPINQVAMVKHLVETCPHTGLKPKLMDLLRDFVHWDQQYSEAHEATWEYIDESWGQIMDNCFEKKGASENVTQTPWDRMMEHVEMCVSILSLVRIWMLVHQQRQQGKSSCRMPSVVQNLRPESLTRLQTSLQANLQQWLGGSENSAMASRPEECFRLNLLENTLADTIPLLTA